MKGIIEAALREKRNLTEAESYEVLGLRGLPVPDFQLVSSIDEVEEAADRVGFPLVMKVVSPDILHKTEVGGIRVKIDSKEAARTAFRDIISSVREKQPEARIHGIMMVPQAEEGLEVIVGMKRDQQFGPTVMFGLGGVFIEVLKDVSLRVSPVTEEEAEEMLLEIKGRKLLEGYRGKPPKDLKALKKIIMEISQLAADIPEIAELDLNPIIVYEDGAIIVDAAIIVDDKGNEQAV